MTLNTISKPAFNEGLHEPAQPADHEWRFVDDLQSPMWVDHGWVNREPGVAEISLASGVQIDAGFDDPDGLLTTTYDDLRAFLCAGKVKFSNDSGYLIQTRQADVGVTESFRVDVGIDGCTITAGDTEGIRRGIFYLEDQMLRADGPLLPLGITERSPVIRTRISRCFFGPINRPPRHRDELADEVDYYPDEYLNRLAHHGVNGLWITVRFRDLCRSKIFPGFGQDADRRLAKLRQTVKQCARYGIRVYPFCIEPAGFGETVYLTPPNQAEAHPEVLGHRSTAYTNFCASSKIGQQYMQEATFTLFDAVPELGGLIAIHLNERATHCYSAFHQLFRTNCPRCSVRHPGEVFADVWSAMARGMHQVNPDAELISWLYVPVIQDTSESTAAQKVEMLRDIAAHVPANITFQLNFESGGEIEQCGRSHPMDDYWLSYIGPSDVFKQCAEAVAKNGGRMAGKLQVACSHEVATVPYVPVPGNLYQKYKAMHELGVSTVMQCWYFGNYPSPMTKAAGELSFAPLPESDADFLQNLAGIFWGNNTDAIASISCQFQKAYELYPANVQFSRFGPVHDSVVWPLHLMPVNQPMSPSWLLGFASGGDRVGESFGYEHTLDECLGLCREMAKIWSSGVAELRGLVSRTGRGQDQLNVATALGMQLQSASNVLAFYALRKALPDQAQAQQMQMLKQMEALVQAEINISQRLAILAAEDSRLGFHSEAEGYKYFPAKLQWRVSLLENLLEGEFDEVESAIKQGEPLFAQYTGQAPAGLRYDCQRHHVDHVDTKNKMDDAVWQTTAIAACQPSDAGSVKKFDDRQTHWQAVEDGQAIYLKVQCETPGDPLALSPLGDFLHFGEHIAVHIESQRMGPSHVFRVTPRGETEYSGRRSGAASPWRAEVLTSDHSWSAILIIPFACLDAGQTPVRPLRLNIMRISPGHPTHSWAQRHPLPHRLGFGDDNPADYGWLIHR